MNEAHNYTLEIRYVDRPPETRRFDQARVVIGRDGGDIVLRDSQASAAHAEIEFANGQLVVRDLGSTNGTWLGERQLPQFALSPGQAFRCGNTQLRLMEIVGGQQLIAGRTMMVEAGPISPPPAALAPPASPAPSAPASATAPAPSATQGSSPALVVAAILGSLATLGGVAFGAWYLFMSDGGEAQHAQRDAPEPEPAPPDLPPPPATDPEPLLEPDPNEVLAPEDPDLGEIYRRVGAATVVIRVPGSVGSGVVIDPSGLILTNHHVIDGGIADGLKLGAKVVFGDYSEELHTFEPRKEQVAATVMKVDEDHDLALIKLDDPPEDLPFVSVSTENPHPGQRVAAIGHAGVGMLWAIKGGEISAAGSLAGHTDLLLDADEGDRELLEERKKRFEKMGRVIQSTAKILPGDSGGPLVNLAGEIVGINAFGRIDHGTNQWLSFHVHLAEVRAFIAKLPTRPLAMVPDPWDDAGSWTRVADADLDGRAEVLLLDGSSASDNPYSSWGALIDLDGDSFEAEASAPAQVNAKIDALVEARGFDAEFAVLHESSGAHHYWYDRDGVDGFDLYILDKHGRGEPSEAWSLDELGGAEPLEGLELDDGLSAALFSAPALAQRFTALGSVMFPAEVEGGSASSSSVAGLPRPEHRLDDAQVSFRDGNGDGLNDAVTERLPFDSRTFYDLDQNSIGRTSSAEALKVLLEVARVDSELALIRQGANAWLWYDRDNDGRFELVLRSHDFERGVVDEAYTLDPDAADAAPVPAPEHIGRRMLRPALLTPALAARLAAHPDAGWEADASDDGLASFPSLARSPLASILIDGRVASVTDQGHDLLLFDLDGDSSEGETRAVADSVRRGSFDAEFALLISGGIEWAFYDTDDDGSFELVLVALDPESGVATQAYRIEGPSTNIDAGAGAMLDASHFRAGSSREGFAALVLPYLAQRERD